MVQISHETSTFHELRKFDLLHPTTTHRRSFIIINDSTRAGGSIKSRRRQFTTFTTRQKAKAQKGFHSFIVSSLGLTFLFRPVHFFPLPLQPITFLIIQKQKIKIIIMFTRTFLTRINKHSISTSATCRLVVQQQSRQKATQSVEKEASAAATAAASTKPAAAAESSSEGVPIAASLAAAFAACSTVSAITAAVEYSTADSCLPYSPNGQRFSQDDFMGRFSRMLLACDPRLLLYTESQVRQAQALLDKYEEYAHDRSMDRTLWEARRIADAALHPDTKEVIPHPFRMSGYVPFNGPICVAMVASTSTWPLLFWAWVNQSQNALVNYYVSYLCSGMEASPLEAIYISRVLAIDFSSPAKSYFFLTPFFFLPLMTQES